MMKKKFNITGTCNADLHYTMNTSKKLKETMEMVIAGEYFTINRPRQFGKTTMLFLLKNQLDRDEHYLPIQLRLDHF